MVLDYKIKDREVHFRIDWGDRIIDNNVIHVYQKTNNYRVKIYGEGQAPCFGLSIWANDITIGITSLCFSRDHLMVRYILIGTLQILLV